ncbi:MAG: rod shape-determining protein MreC [Selenomonadaceae bacterium]|nr:rod shape-determining protein MreC [Selenomonadaceae bacterium]
MKERIKREKKTGRKVLVLLFVFVSVFCLVFFAARGKFETPVANTTTSLVLSPFQSVVSWVVTRLNFITSTVDDIMNVHEQNKLLLAEIEQLRAKNLAASEFEAENQRLRALLGYKEGATQFDLLPARVIGREASTWSSTIVINRGTADGVADNMAVVTELGLVGHVSEAGLNSSKVQLILDPRSSVGTLIQRPESRVAGIVEGDINNPTAPKMVNIPKNSDVIVNDVIVTSGFGGIYPKGIIVGHITDIKNDEGGLLKVALVETNVNFQKLEDVAIILQSREAPPAPLQQPETQQSGQQTNNQ